MVDPMLGKNAEKILQDIKARGPADLMSLKKRLNNPYSPISSVAFSKALKALLAENLVKFEGGKWTPL
jgi:gentisate 1,2-dioxygenase